MKKTTRTVRKVLSVFLAVLMMLTTWAVAVPGLVLAADGNKYYVKVYVNIYDGSDGYGGAYQVDTATGKPANYSWATNDGWYGRINMTGFTVFGEGGDYDAQDVSAALLEAEKLNTYYAMSGLSDNNANGDWDSKAIAKAEYVFTLDSFPVEIFWMNDENNWDGGNTGFAIRKLTVATSEGGTEHTMWEGLAGSDSETYNYYGSITPTGIHTCFEDYAKNYDMNDYKFYKSITTSSQRAWTDPYTYGSAGTYYLNEYANGGVSATFSEGATSVASTVDYIDTSSTDTYYVNYTNHSKTQIAEITGTYNDGNFVSSPYGIKLNPGETRSFEINKSNYSKLAKYNNAANFTFEYTLSDVYASDELNAPLAKFTQPTYIGLWNEANDSPKYITDEDGDGSTGYTLKISDNYDWGDNSMTMTNTFQVTEGIIERNSATTGSGSNSVTFNYNYYVDVSNVSTWEDTGLRIYVTEDEYYRLPFQPNEYPSECGTITLSGNYANTDAASITIADIAFTNVTEDFWYSHSQASGYSTYGYYNQKGTPMWATQGKDAQATFYNNNPGWLRFAGTMIEPSDSSADPAKIVMDKMVYRENQNGKKAYFSGTINVYAFDKAELRDYIQKTLLDFAPMSLRYNTTAFENYQNKLASAMNVLADQKTTQKAVTDALAELKSAVEALQANANLVNQIDELTHIQYVDGIGSEIANQTAKRYVLIPLGEHTVPQKAEYIGNGTYKDATNKKSNLTTNYTVEDTEIDYLNYYYWNIDYSQVDGTIALVDKALKNFDSDTYSSTLKTALENAKEQLEDIDQITTGDNTPTSQEDVDNVIKAATDLLAHIDEGYEHCDYDANDDGENELKTKASTCSEAGYTYYKCNICGKVQKVAYLELEEHTWDAGTETTAPECGNAGVITYTCLVCGVTKTELTTEIGTHYFQISDNGDGTHISKCSKCGANEEGATAEAHTYNYTNNADGTHTATCSVCNAIETTAHSFTKSVLTRPTFVDGVWKDGYYTYSCKNCNATKTEAVKRATYTAYDEAVAGLNNLLANDTLTDAARGEINKILEDNKIADDFIITEQDKVDAAADALKVVLDKIANDTTGAYEKVDYTAYDAAVEAYEALDSVMSDADKAAVEAIKTEIAKIPADGSKADYQTQVDKAAADIAAINGKYSGCSTGSHSWGTPVLTTPPTADTQGEYTETCGICGATQITKVDLAEYDEFDAAVKALEELAKTENLTDEAKQAIENALTKAENLDKNLPADVTTVDGKEIKGGQDKIDALVEELNDVVADTNTAINNGSALKPNYTAWDEAETAYDALDKTNVKSEIIAEADDLKAEIAEKQADDTLTQATATQAQINEATARLNAIIAGINDGSLVNVDTTEADEAIGNAESHGVLLSEEEVKKLEELRNQLDEIANNTDANAKDDQATVDLIRDQANAIYNKYTDCAAGNHNRTDWVLTLKPTETVAGKYESTCTICGTTSFRYVAREDYTAYDAAVERAETMLENSKYTPEAITKIQTALAEAKTLDQQFPKDLYDYDGTTKLLDNNNDVVIKEATDKLNAVLDSIANDTTGAYEKVDFTNYNNAVNAYKALDSVMTDADKAAVEAIKTEIALIPEDGTAAQYQTQVDEAAAKIAEINAKYGDCANGNHNWGAPVLTTAPTADAQGEYTETCGTCGKTQITKVDLADYEEFDEAVKALNELAKTENLTDAAKAAIEEALDKAEALDKNLPANVTTLGGQNVKGGQDTIDALVAELSGVVADTNTAINNGSALKPDYTAWETAEGAYDALDKTNVKSEIIAEANALKSAIAEKQADDTLTQATATQPQINAATARLNEIIAAINGILTEKPDFKGYDASHDAYEELVNQYGDKIKDSVAGDVTDLDEIVEGVRNDETATKVNDQDTIDDAKTALDAIIAGINDGSLIKDADYTNVDKDLADAKEKAENNDVINGVKEDIQEIEDALNEIKNKTNPEANAIDQPTIDALEKQLEEIIAGINDGTLIKPDFKEADKDLADAKNKAENNDVIDGVDKAIQDIEDALNKIRNDNTATKADDQDDVDALEKELEDIIAGINDGSLVKPNYTDAETTIENAENTGSLTDADKDALEDLKDKLDEIKNDPTSNKKDDQTAVNEIKDAVQDIVDKYADCENGNHNWGTPVLTTAPTADAQGEYTETCGTCGATQITKVNLAVYDALNDAVDALEDLLGTKNLTDAAKATIETALKKAEALDKNLPADVTTVNGKEIKGGQDKIDALVEELEKVVADTNAGIADGSLIKPDYTEVDKDLADAKNKAENNDVIDGVKNDIKNIEDKLNDLKKDPATNKAEHQDDVDALEKELEDIIAGINDGSLVKPDYTDADKAIEDAEKDIDGGKLSDEDQKALDDLKDKLDEIKNDPTSNSRDDQDDVDEIKNTVQDIVNKYAECAKGNHVYETKTVDPNCTDKGYDLHTCNVCGKSYKDNYVDAKGHVEEILPAVEPTCSSTGLTEGKKCSVCGAILVAQQEISTLPHTDADGDGTCDVCGKSGLYDGCACLCHNNHWLWRIVYLIIRIIWKVFKIHQVCPCGLLHY